MKYVIDIDGTICTQECNYGEAKPFDKIVKRINMLYDEGHIIWLFTARGTDTSIDWSELTVSQLADWGLKYHRLLFGKPSADKYVDDKAVNAAGENW